MLYRPVVRLWIENQVSPDILSRLEELFRNGTTAFSCVPKITNGVCNQASHLIRTHAEIRESHADPGALRSAIDRNAAPAGLWLRFRLQRQHAVPPQIPATRGLTIRRFPCIMEL